MADSRVGVLVASTGTVWVLQMVALTERHSAFS